jgi:hypothetical protein
MAIKLIVPVKGPITQLFGENPQIYKKWGYAGHNGIDYGIPNGTPIVAAADGTVDKVDFENGGYGNYVKMSHMDGATKFYTYYAHLQSASVKAGQKILAGTVVGLSNNTGASTGPHLHFGVKVDGQNPAYKGYLDPTPLFVSAAPPPVVPPPAEKPQPPVAPPPAPAAPKTLPGAIDLPGLALEVIYDGVNVRPGPGLEFAAVMQLKVGSALKARRLHSLSAWVEFEQGKWCAITFNQAALVKVVSSGVLNSLPVTPTPGAISLPSLGLEVTSEFLRVRSGPGTQHPELTQIKLGAKITARQLFATRAWVEFEPDQWAALTFEGLQYIKFV